MNCTSSCIQGKETVGGRMRAKENGGNDSKYDTKVKNGVSNYQP